MDAVCLDAPVESAHTTGLQREEMTQSNNRISRILELNDSGTMSQICAGSGVTGSVCPQYKGYAVECSGQTYIPCSRVILYFMSTDRPIRLSI